MAYVYGHYRADTDELFYIGKGTGKRAWSKRGRNKHWQYIVAKHGYTVKILVDNLTDEEADNKEIELIAEVGLANLTNVTPGGTGWGTESGRETAIQAWKNPAYRRRAEEWAKARWDTFSSEQKERIMAGYAKHWHSEERIKKMQATMQKKNSTPEGKKKMGKMAHKYWDKLTPEERSERARRAYAARKKPSSNLNVGPIDNQQ